MFKRKVNGRTPRILILQDAGFTVILGNQKADGTSFIAFKDDLKYNAQYDYAGNLKSLDSWRVAQWNNITSYFPLSNIPNNVSKLFL